jgi:hypothetical protein
VSDLDAPEEMEKTYALLAKREREVWEAIRMRDVNALASLSAPDYVSISQTEQLEWPAVVEHVRRGSLVSYSLGEMTFRTMTPEVVAIAFRATVTVERESEKPNSEAAILSIWVLRGGRWLSALAHEIFISSEHQ